MNVPTGYSKSFVYQVLLFCASFILKRLGKAGKTPPAVLVVSPLQRIPAFTADYDGSDVHKSCSTRSLTTLPSCVGYTILGHTCPSTRGGRGQFVYRPLD